MQILTPKKPIAINNNVLYNWKQYKTEQTWQVYIQYWNMLDIALENNMIQKKCNTYINTGEFKFHVDFRSSSSL